MRDVRVPNASPTPCSWCYAETPAPWKITPVVGQDEYTCTAHGTEWWPGLFPESDPRTVAEIVQEILARN